MTKRPLLDTVSHSIRWGTERPSDSTTIFIECFEYVRHLLSDFSMTFLVSLGRFFDDFWVTIGRLLGDLWATSERLSGYFWATIGLPFGDF